VFDDYEELEDHKTHAKRFCYQYFTLFVHKKWYPKPQKVHKLNLNPNSHIYRELELQKDYKS